MCSDSKLIDIQILEIRNSWLKHGKNVLQRVSNDFSLGDKMGLLCLFKCSDQFQNKDEDLILNLIKNFFLIKNLLE